MKIYSLQEPKAIINAQQYLIVKPLKCACLCHFYSFIVGAAGSGQKRKHRTPGERTTAPAESEEFAELPEK